jgi:hypothetical protein
MKYYLNNSVLSESITIGLCVIACTLLLSVIPPLQSHSKQLQPKVNYADDSKLINESKMLYDSHFKKDSASTVEKKILIEKINILKRQVNIKNKQLEILINGNENN